MAAVKRGMDIVMEKMVGFHRTQNGISEWFVLEGTSKPIQSQLLP